MVPTEKSLESTANTILACTKLVELAASFECYVTGSLPLKTMAWPDIDLNLCFHPNLRSDVYELASSCMTLSPSWIELRCTENEPDSPGHFFLGFEIEREGVLWNFDLWFLSVEEYDTGKSWLDEVNRKLDDSMRDSAIELKRFLMKKHKYPNGISSIEVYDAVLEKGILNNEDREKWWINCHIT